MPPSSREAPVEVVAYDPAWPLAFEAERAVVESVLARWLNAPAEHIGSTAIPGLVAKPVIDIMAPVSTLEASRPAIEAAATAGYLFFPYRPDEMHWFCKPSPGFRTHHLHLVPLGSTLWDERLAFRDALRNNPSLAMEYAGLKLRLATQFRWDREAYTDAKTPFIRRVLSGPGAHGQNPR